MLTKKNLLVLLVLMFLISYSMIFSTTAQGAPIPMIISHDAVLGGTEDKAMIRFAEVIEKLTDGEIKPKVYPAAQLGAEKEELQGIKAGTIHASDITTGVMTNWVPEMGICDLPYVFRSEKHVKRCLFGPIGEFIGKKAEDKGFTVLGYYLEGFRNISSKKPYTTLEDLKGLRLRTMQSPPHLKGYKAMGINVTPIPGTEVYMAIKTGLVDATEFPFTFWYENKYYEILKHINLTGVFYCPEALIVGSKFFESLTPKQKTAIRIAAEEASNAFLKFRDEDLAKYVKEAKDKGVLFHEVNTEPLAKVCAPIRREFAEQFAGKEGIDLVDLIEKLFRLD